MKDQLITFETAKLAKKKGFDFPNKASQNDYMGEYPTQSLLQRWLREEKSIWCGVTPISLKVYKYWYHGTGNTYSGGRADSWEEALEAGLVESLKLIKV